MTCPHCRTRYDILEIETLPENPAYQQQTVPVLKCPRGHYYALRPDPIIEIPRAPRQRRRR